jgi:putative DNA primase/helicase
MRSELNTDLLRRINADLESRIQVSARSAQPKLDASSTGVNPQVFPETPEEIAKIKSALAVLSSDVPRGNGKLYTPGSYEPTADYWLLVIWSIASLGWKSGKTLAREWSANSQRYSDEGFEAAWHAYDYSAQNPIRIGSLFKLAKHHGWQPLLSSLPDTSSNTERFRLLSPLEVLSRPPQAWRVKNLLPDQGLAAIFGPSGSGKSFLALDLAIRIADGQPWFGVKTFQAPVVYVMLEGESGLRNRLAAHEIARGAPLSGPFHVVLEQFSLTTGRDVVDLAAAVPVGAVVFIDTLNRAAPTADENSSKEMGAILQGAKQLQERTRGLIVMIHHTGKDPTKGMRGHSSLHAALDAAIEVERSASGSRAWTVAKAKDGEDGKQMSFKLIRHVLGIDSDGEEISSCSVAPDHAQIFVKTEPQGQRQKAALKALKAAIASPQCTTTGIAGCPSGTKCMKVEDAVLVIAGALVTTASNKRTNAARSLLQSLLTSSHLVAGTDSTKEAWCWLG